MVVGFDGCGNRTTLSNSNPALVSYTYTVNDLNQYTAMIAGAVATPTATPTATPAATPTPPPGQSPTPTPPPGSPPPTPPPQQVAEPTFNPDDGHIFNTAGTKTIAVATTTTIANMRYTFGTATPSASYRTLITASSGTVSVTPTEEGRTLNVIAFTPGWIASEVHSATYYYLDGDAPGAPAAAAPSYDSNGNLTSYKGWTYTYDAQNRLTGANKGATTAFYYYDGKNRQIARSLNGVAYFNVWDDWELIEEYNTGNARTAAYLQGAHGPVKSLMANNIYYYQDSLGSTTHIANASGALLESYRYDLYGKPSYYNTSNESIPASAHGITDLYAGERWVSELGLYDLRNRFMSPELGRFLQADPIGFKGDASNLYRYCHNDFANFSDPTGLDQDSPRPVIC
jgi:RHS repeat-associated protein